MGNGWLDKKEKEDFLTALGTAIKDPITSIWIHPNESPQENCEDSK